MNKGYYACADQEGDRKSQVIYGFLEKIGPPGK